MRNYIKIERKHLSNKRRLSDDMRFVFFNPGEEVQAAAIARVIFNEMRAQGAVYLSCLHDIGDPAIPEIGFNAIRVSKAA